MGCGLCLGVVGVGGWVAKSLSCGVVGCACVCVCVCFGPHESKGGSNKTPQTKLLNLYRRILAQGMGTGTRKSTTI